MTLTNDEKNNFFVSTLSKIKFKNDDIGYIVVSEQANDITTAVKERKHFHKNDDCCCNCYFNFFSIFK